MSDRDIVVRRAVVFGATGAIGSAIVDQLSAISEVETVYAGSRVIAGAMAGNVRPFRFDLLDEESIAMAATAIGADGPLDLVMVATGILHDNADLKPEKSWREFQALNFAHAFAVNATGPALIAKHFLPLLRRERRSVFAALSARVGSIEDNRLGGWAAYRASKAALHQIVRTCAIELARKNPSAFCIALHPGTVASSLSKPFQRSVAPGVLFAPSQSAAHLLNVISNLKQGDTGRAFAWDGSHIPF